MFKIALSLVRIAKELRRIREILEFVFRDELEKQAILARYSSTPLSMSDIVVDSSPLIKRDDYGRVLEEEELEDG